MASAVAMHSHRVDVHSTANALFICHFLFFCYITLYYCFCVFSFDVTGATLVASKARLGLGVRLTLARAACCSARSLAKDSCRARACLTLSTSQASQLHSQRAGGGACAGCGMGRTTTAWAAATYAAAPTTAASAALLCPAEAL